MRALVLIAAIGCSESSPVEPPDEHAPAAPAEPAAPVPTPLEAARAAIARGCETGDGRACLASGEPEEACVHGEARGCLTIAERGGPDAPRYLARACRRRSREACDRLREPLKDPRLIGGAMLGDYQPAVLDCWAETAGLDRDRELRGTIAVTVGLDGRTTAIARFADARFRSCIETSASRWVFDGNRDIELTIRPRQLDDPFAGLGSLDNQIGVLRGGGVVGGVLGGSSGSGGLGFGGLGGGGTGFGLPPFGQVRLVIGEIDDTLDRRSVERKVKSVYLVGVKRCYRRALDADRRLETAVHLRLTVTPSGAVDGIRATSAGPDELRRCIKGQVGRWRFRPPRTDDAKPAIARVQISLHLSPR